MTTVPEEPDEADGLVPSLVPEEPEEYEPTGPDPATRTDADEADLVERVIEIPDDEADEYR
jgi:hypothetical protein